MITILVEQFHPRISYATELVFRTLLDTACRCIPVSEYQPGKIEGPFLNYTHSHIPDIPRIPCHGLLYERHVREGFVPEVVRPGAEADITFPILFPNHEDEGAFFIPFDIFSAVFYLAVEYSHYSHNLRDDHDRHDEWGLFPLFNLWFNDEPLAHYYAEWLWTKLLAQFPSLSRKTRKFDYEITIDVDHPWKYKHKRMVVNMGGLAKDLLARRFQDAGERMGVLFKGHDPYDVWSEIRDLCPRERTRFFFLIDRHGPQDSRYTFRHVPYRKLIMRLTREWGFQGGLHPSYQTYNDPEMLEFEHKALGVLIPNFRSSRQHYLRYRLPITFRTLETLGIEAEYSVCPVKYAGFKTGICVPYRWFDLEQNRTSTLTLHPAVVMDRSLQQYKRMDPLFALKEIQAVIERVKRVKGKFVVILHNETFSESGEWKGWKPVLVNMLEILKKETLHEG